MAKDAVDAVAHGLDGKVPGSCTDQVALIGGDGFQALWNSRHRLSESSGLHVARVEHLLRRYGTLVEDLLSLIRERPDLGRPIEGADDYLRAEIVYAATHEGARHVNDVLSRRTRISIETWDRGVRAAREVAELLAPELGWSNEQTEREIEYYEKRVEAERISQEQEGDLEADATRRGVPDIVPTMTP
jgi:glycerol-3-phosphate dehydrogenase